MWNGNNPQKYQENGRLNYWKTGENVLRDIANHSQGLWEISKTFWGKYRRFLSSIQPYRRLAERKSAFDHRRQF